MGLVIERWPPADDALTCVRSEPGCVVMSSGEVLLVKYDKLQALVEQLVQEGCPVQIRTWWTKQGMELIHIHREGVFGSLPITLGESDSF